MVTLTVSPRPGGYRGAKGRGLARCRPHGLVVPAMAGSKYLDLMRGLPSLDFEASLSQEEKTFCKRARVRAWARIICGCAHAAFFCRLLTAVRCKVLGNSCFHHSWLAKFNILRSNSGCLRIGVLGSGHMGKQLVQVLMQHAQVAPKDITISSRRQDTYDELMYLGLQYTDDNQKLAASVDVLFLCCPPFQLTLISSQIRGHLAKTCVVYSLVTAVPSRRLQNLLGHSNILKPHYNVPGITWTKLWERSKNIVDGLLPQDVIEHSCPFKQPYLVCVNPKWFEEVLYSVLNQCHFLQVPHLSSVEIINYLLFGATHGMEAFDYPEMFVCESFVNESCADSLSRESSFPWFELSTVSMQDTPLTKFFKMHPRLRQHLSFVYRMTMLRTQNPPDDRECCGD